jgi:hypothetical protein
MRAGTSYDCDKCERRNVARSALCEPGCAHPRDENGNAPPRPGIERFEWNRGVGLDKALIAAFVRPSFRLAMAVKRMSARNQITALVEAAGPPAPIARAGEGLSQIEGEVEILEPVHTLAGEPCAAFLEQQVMRAPHPSFKNVTVERIEVRRGFGRFLVRDETGVALIDDDFVRLFDADGRTPDATEQGVIIVRAGDRVRVVGYGKRGPALASAASSLRGAPSALCFDGGTRRPVCIFQR